jgi:preprotein translocase subunit SecG
MRASGAKYIDILSRLASVLATLFIGVAFVMVTSVNAAPPDKKVEVKDKAKIEKIEKIEKVDKLDSKARNERFFNNNNKLDNVRFFNNRAFFNRGLFIDRDEFFD